MNSEKVLGFFNEVNDDSIKFLIVLLSLIIIVGCVDWLFGWINARFNKDVVFQSNIALFGIIKKMMYFVVLVIFMFTAFLLVDSAIAITALTTLYIGYLLSELNSVLSHLGLTSDGKTGELFINFIENIFKRR